MKTMSKVVPFLKVVWVVIVTNEDDMGLDVLGVFTTFEQAEDAESRYLALCYENDWDTETTIEKHDLNIVNPQSLSA
jgi:hypothetical protein